MEVNNEPYHYQWIVNEGLLRDEGTLYGISGAGTLEKTDAIRDYYRIKKATHHTRQAHLKEKIEELKKQASAEECLCKREINLPEFNGNKTAIHR